MAQLPRICRTNNGGNYYHNWLPSIGRSDIGIKLVVPYRYVSGLGQVPCVQYNYSGYDFNTGNYKYSYIHIPYADSTIRTSTVSVNTDNITTQRNCIAGLSKTGYWKMNIRPLDIFKWMQDHDYCVGNIPTISYRVGSSGDNLGDYVVIPKNTTYLRTQFTAAYMLRTAINNVMPPWGTYNADANGAATFRFKFANTNSYTNSQISSLLGSDTACGVHLVANGGSTAAPDGYWYDCVQCTQQFVWDNDYSYIYIELPKITSVGVRMNTGEQTDVHFDGSVQVIDYFFTVTQYPNA